MHQEIVMSLKKLLAIGAALSVAAFSVAAQPAAAQTAIERMQQPGPEAQRLARRAGVWNLVITLRPSPDAPPIVWSNLIAERAMVGLFLQEIIRPAPESQGPDFRRISYLTYNKVEGRWQYVSLDTRFPAGIMPAYSVDKGSDREIELQFESLAFAGWGENVDGWMMRSNYVVMLRNDDRETAQQHWTRADGSGVRWLAVQYEYTRRP
jgi:hypothetical protein